MAMTGLFSLNFQAVFAQQMVFQILGGGYRFDGPSAITFDTVKANTTDATISERTIRDITSGGYTNPPSGGQSGFISIADYNGNSTFQISVSASGDLINQETASYSIPIENLKIKNITDGVTPEIDEVHGSGLVDALTLNPSLNNYQPLNTGQILATGTGQAPGEWKFYPTFELTIPPATALGTYKTTLIFTII